MFALPTLALAPVANDFGALVLPIDGALLGWFMVVALIVSAIGVLRGSSTVLSTYPNHGVSAVPASAAPGLRRLDASHKAAA